MASFEKRDAAGVPKWHKKLCKQVGRLAESVPGISCDFPDRAADDQPHDSTRGLKSKLMAEESKSRRFREELHKEKAEKQKAEAKAQEMMREKSDIRKKERRAEAEKKQSAHYKSRLEFKIGELEEERNAKREREQDLKLLKAEQDEASQMKHRLEDKVRSLERDLEHLAQNEDANRQQRRQQQGFVEQLLEALEIEKAKKTPVCADAYGAASCSESSLAAAASTAGRQFRAIVSAAAVVFAFLAIVVAGLNVFHQRKENIALRTQLSAKILEVDLQNEQQTNLQEEFNTELGGMMKISSSVSTNLGTDFDYHIYDEKVDHGTVRYIKIQCPGARHCDVFVEIIFNGCIVSINRQAARGVDAVQWEQRFQFRPSEGLFEFKEDQVALDQGFLILVFRAFAFQSRPFRFPKHFDLAETDVDGTWEYPQDNVTLGNATDPSLHGRDAAPGRLEIHVAAAFELEGNAVEGLGAEASGSPIDTEDCAATYLEVAQAAVQYTASAESADGGKPGVAAFQGSPEVTGDDGAQNALESEGSSEGFEKVDVEDVAFVAEEELEMSLKSEPSIDCL
jgi:hypothetical protein